MVQAGKAELGLGVSRGEALSSSEMMSRSKSSLQRLAVAVATLLVGCTPKPNPDAERHGWTDADKQAFRESWGNGVVAAPHPSAVSVAAGPAPLAYITEQPAEITITDNVGNHWGPTSVPARTVVRVAEQTGIAAGSVRLSGPLPEGRTYTIQMSLPPESGWINGTQRGAGKE